MHLSKIILVTLIGLISCSQDDEVSIESDITFNFQDGFETINNDLNELFPNDGSRWTGIQIVNPNNAENNLDLNQNIVNEGNTSLRILSKPSDDVLSKIDIEKGGFFAPLGSTLTIEADFYINSTENLKDLFLMDVECCSCWDPTVPNNQCPGIRLMLAGDDNYLSIERGKILGNTIAQTTYPFPRNEWVTIQWEMILSDNDNGMNKLRIDGTQVIEESGRNLPNKAEFEQAFAMVGTEFQLQEPLGYERIQLGATANPTEFEMELFIDNFKLSIR